MSNRANNRLYSHRKMKSEKSIEEYCARYVEFTIISKCVHESKYKLLLR